MRECGTVHSIPDFSFRRKMVFECTVPHLWHLSCILDLMAFKAAKSKSKSKWKDARSALPCLFILIFGMGLLFLLFYALLRQG